MLSLKHLLHHRTCQPLLLAALLLAGLPGAAEPELIGNNLGASSSKAGNNLFDTDTIEREPSAQPRISPAEAADLVRRKLGGQVMGVSTQHKDTGVVYGVKLHNAGRMRVIHVDGQSGQLLNH